MADVGAVATQADVNVGYGQQGIDLLRQGLTAQEVLKKLLADDKFPGLILQQWGKEWLSMDLVDEETYKFLKKARPDIDKQRKGEAQGNRQAGLRSRHGHSAPFAA
jgi:hypothetical protein